MLGGGGPLAFPNVRHSPRPRWAIWRDKVHLMMTITFTATTLVSNYTKYDVYAPFPLEFSK